MQVNINVIKTQRNNRAWSQTQLAEVSGLSLRTIQRIEKTGVASLESVKSLASVFEMDIKNIQKWSNKSVYSLKSRLATLFGVVGLILSGVVMVPAAAQSIMVDLELLENNVKLASIEILNEENTESEMKISDVLKITFTSTKENDGTVLISTKVYDLSDGNEVLISSPSVKTKHRETAEIRFGNYSLSLTPNL
ncbi:helix-turn-helix transcriptional regulator [Colwellia sp. BRX10-1]|nr:helix-turn-helix transcriptional regulator [Colwellia sp. BRX8-9]MBA6379272.1 helix-turn-helix transcriptional regulator [Colwellia sp. BRX10-7]MBA6385114.1 helix-turn-helix transcriptional regulator [Colwellia sp. BRX10-9]MBA6385982.1 helix-turn-helix transcriptional regulator [Colwellia sp. BRX10-2]MBA6403201.1 helix-turn-helix transcriptional regulator [Colwellia sp. BRX10-5]MBA6406930.1 helix-turn-helix transcriptional regulator [Colwellia sp. BRX10-1]